MALTLKGARANAGFTQKEVSQRLGITTVTLSNWEKGKTFPKVDQIFRLADLYGVSVNDFIFLK